MEKITPRVDIAFKKIFGVEENKDLLISLINSIVSDEDQILEATLLNPYNPKNFRNDKLSILDIKAKGDNGRRFNIEIQIRNFHKVVLQQPSIPCQSDQLSIVAHVLLNELSEVRPILRIQAGNIGLVDFREVSLSHDNGSLAAREVQDEANTCIGRRIKTQPAAATFSSCR